MSELILNNKVIKPRLYNTISEDFLVLAVMYEGQNNDNNYSFRDVVRKLSGIVEEKRISMAEDRLFDLGLINNKWSKKDGVYSKKYIVLGESELLAKQILDYLEARIDRMNERCIMCEDRGYIGENEECPMCHPNKVGEKDD